MKINMELIIAIALAPIVFYSVRKMLACVERDNKINHL